MEQETTADGQIHASIAKRVGLLLTQYETLTGHLPANQRYEATLCLSLLQTLLTQCMELIKSKELADLTTALDLPLSDEPSPFGLSKACVQTHTMWSPDKLTHKNVISSLRNAMSHPNKQTESTPPVTGFTQYLSNPEPSEDGLREIEGFEFIHSPWVLKSGKDVNAGWTAPATDAEKRQQLEKNVRKFKTNHGLENLTVEHRSNQSNYKVYQGGDLFIPVLKLKLTTADLRTLTLKLSCLLALPLKAKKDASSSKTG